MLTAMTTQILKSMGFPVPSEAQKPEETGIKVEVVE
jgi:hypothetical protein